MSETSVHPLIPVFTQLASCIQLWIDNGRDPQRVLSLMANWLSSPQADLGNSDVSNDVIWNVPVSNES